MVTTSNGASKGPKVKPTDKQSKNGTDQQQQQQQQQPSQGQEDDNRSVGSNSSSNFQYQGAPGFSEADFLLPPECPIDVREIKKYRDSIRAAKNSFYRKLKHCEDASDLRAVDEFKTVSMDTIPHPNPRKKGVTERPIQVNVRRAELEASKVLNTVKSAISYKQFFPDDIENMNFEPSTRDNPQIGSYEEKLEDLYQEEVEEWCKRKGLTCVAKYTNKQKRLLRKWFRDMDDDGSGEVSVVELLDPMLSSGILKTKEQCMRLLSNVDRNLTAGIDFDEFILALSSDKLADSNKLAVLQEMSANPIFSMETLLTMERRRKIFTSVVDEMNFREERVERKLNKLNDPKNSKSKFFREQREYEKLEEAQKASKELHDTYMSNLSIVVKEKLEGMGDKGIRPLPGALAESSEYASSLADGNPSSPSAPPLSKAPSNRISTSLESRHEPIRYEDIDKSIFPVAGSFGVRPCGEVLERNPYIAYSPMNTTCHLFNSNISKRKPSFDPTLTATSSTSTLKNSAGGLGTGSLPSLHSPIKQASSSSRRK